MTSFTYLNFNIKFTKSCKQNIDKLTFLKSNYKYKRRYQHKQQQNSRNKRRFLLMTEMQKKCKKIQKVTNYCFRKNYAQTIGKNPFSRISKLFLIIIVNLLQIKKNNNKKYCNKTINNVNNNKNNNDMYKKLQPFEVITTTETTTLKNHKQQQQKQLKVFITDATNYDDEFVDGSYSSSSSSSSNNNHNVKNSAGDDVKDIIAQNVHDVAIVANPVAFSDVNATNHSVACNDDVNVDIDEINIQQNYDKVSTRMRCQQTTTTTTTTTATTENVAKNTLTTSITTTATPSMTTQTATAMVASTATSTTTTTATVTEFVAALKSAHILRCHWLTKQMQHFLRWQYECNSILNNKSFKNINININNNNNNSNKNNSNKIKNSNSNSNSNSNKNKNKNSSNNSYENSNITNSISDFSTQTTNRRLPTDCGYRGNALSILLTLFIGLAMCAKTVQAGACWRNFLDNGKCSAIFSLNTTKSECCGANQEFSYTDHELTSVEYFFATTIGGGMECKPCIDSCDNVTCGLNKKCIKRKGRPRCICAPECGAAARHHKAESKFYHGHKHHNTNNKKMHIIESAADIITRDDKGFRDCVGISGSGSGSGSGSNSGSCSSLLFEKSPRDIRSLSSEITNMNLGLEGVLHDNYNQRNPSQQKPQIIKREPKSGRLYITANVVHNDKPATTTTTTTTKATKTTKTTITQRLQIFSNVAPLNNNNNNNNKNKKNKNKNKDKNKNKNNHNRNIQAENRREYRNGRHRYKNDATSTLTADRISTETKATLLKETERGSTMSRHKLNRYKNRNDYELTKNQQQELQARIRHIRMQKHQHQHQHQQQYQHENENEHVQLHEHEIVDDVENAPNLKEVENKYNNERQQQQYEHKRKYNKKKLRDHNANMNRMQTTIKLPTTSTNSSLAATTLTSSSSSSSSSSSVAAINNLTMSTSVYNTTTKALITKAATNLTNIATLQTSLQTTPANSMLSADRRLLNHGSNTATSSTSASTATLLPTSLTTSLSSSLPAAIITESSLTTQHAHHPVCGTDGRTYHSECQLRKRACRTNNLELKVAYRGHCRTTCNGVKCLNGLTCVEDHYTIPHCIACKIDCPQDDQNDVIDPSRAVCGVDGKTYKSTCDINRMICKVGRSIAVAYPGPCRVDHVTCNNIICGPKKTCLVDLLTEEPRCVTCRYKCPRNRQKLSFFGQQNKLCGVNHRTYNSYCELLRDSCRTGLFIEVKATGECKTNEFSV